MRFTHAVALALVLSGCLGGSGPADDSQAPAPSTPGLGPELTAPTVLAPVRLGRADIGSEPNIAAAPDGTLYVTTPLQLWRSSDNGVTYEALGEPWCPVFQVDLPACAPPLQQRNPGLVGGGDGDLAVDGAGIVHWLGLGGEQGPIPYQSSSDRAETFGTAIDLSDGGGFDRQWIDATPDGRVFAAWRDDDGLVVNRSPDGGATWLGKVNVTDDAVAGPIVHDPSHASRWYVPSVTSATVQLSRSDDQGETWATQDVLQVARSPGDVGFATSIFPVLAVDDAGTLYLVVSHRTEVVPPMAPKPVTQYAVFLTVSRDHGESWSPELQVSPPLQVAVFPWIAAGAPGRVAIAYYQNTVGLPNDNLPDLWNVKLLESVDADAGSPAFQAVQLNADPIHVGSICTMGSACLTTAGDRSMLDFFELTIPPDGQPKVTWSGDAFTPPYLSSTVWAGGVASGTPLR